MLSNQTRHGKTDTTTRKAFMCKRIMGSGHVRM